MASAPFVDLAGALVEAMGQRLEAARPIPEGLALRTGDGFLYAFFESPNDVSIDSVRRLFEGDELPVHLVVLTAGHLPLAIEGEVVRRGGTVVQGPRFHELARQLGLGPMLGDEPRAERERPKRLLPSAQQLDQVMTRARTWLDWGVPALALRFYRQAGDLKPEFLPARIGAGRALLALGLIADGERVFDELLANHPTDVDARLGKAAALGAKSRPHEEIAVYRALLAEDEARLEVRAHLVAALVELADWAGARVEIEAMLARTPEDPQLRFLHGVALERTREGKRGAEERVEARRLGLPYEREAALCEHLKLPPPPPPSPLGGPEGPRSVAPTRVTSRGRPSAARRPASRPRRTAPPRRRTPPRPVRAPRKRK